MEIYLALGENDLLEIHDKCASTMLQPGNDHTGCVTFSGLKSDSRYYYAILLDGQPAIDPDQRPLPSFQTFPPAGDTVEDFSFAFGSCFIPRRYSDTMFKSMAKLKDELNLRFFMMIGDNVYVDDYIEKQRPFLPQRDMQPPCYLPPVAHLLPLYREAYRDAWQFDNFRAFLKHIPTFMIFDDHEFWNNWGSSPHHRWEDEGFVAAVQAYWEYQDSHNPDAAARHQDTRPRYYYTFEYGGAGFFVLDCRTRRNPAARPWPTMIGQEQRAALFEWLKENNERYQVKFVVSSVPIAFAGLPHWLVAILQGHLGDQWLGYKSERTELFKFIRQEKITGVHFLSGDIHLGQGTVLRSTTAEDDPVLYSYTSSPLAQTIWLLSEDLPAWSSWVAGLIIGIVVGLLIGDRLAPLATSVTRWLGIPVLAGTIGAIIGWLLKRYLSLKVASLLRYSVGKLLYGLVRVLAQFYYLAQIARVSADVITGGPNESLHYRAQNLFPLADEINVGIVHVRRNGETLTVQYALYDRNGQLIREENEPHVV